MLPLSEPLLSGREWEYVKETLDTGWISSSGHFVNLFEERVAARLGLPHAVSCVNGTCAIHLALVVAGVRPGDEVIVPTLTFIAPVNAASYAGAVPVFMDADPLTLGMDAAKLADFLETRCEARDGGLFNRSSRRRIAAVVPVHVFGHPCDLDPMTKVCAARGVPLIEDATESLGSRYKERHAGTAGVMGCLSFNGNKIITTGGGGMIVSADKALADRARHLSTQAKKDPVAYEHDAIGYNYRMTNVAAAIGVAQLEQLDGFVEKKKKIHSWYRSAFSGLRGLTLFEDRPWAESNYWLNFVRIAGGRRTDVARVCRERRIEVRPVWQLNHRQPMYSSCETFAIEHAPVLWDEGLNIPSWLGMTEEDAARVAVAFRDGMEGP
jgi:perosamine synthetase